MIRTATILAAAVAALPALAQETPPPGEGASAVLCSDLTALSADEATPVLYYLSGFNQGQLTGMVGAQGVEGEGAAKTVATSDAGSAAATGINPDEDAATKAMDIMGLQQAGFDQIPVDDVLSTCGDRPDAPVIDVMKEL